MKPLEGIKIIDLTTAWSAPFGTMQLADHGAEVIKIENTKMGDGSRTWSPLLNGEQGKSIWYPVVNRNKKSITLNLRTDKAKEILLDLVKTADVVTENFRGGTLEKMGLDYEVLKSVKPDIILARLSGYGQTGPYRTKPAYSNLAEAMGGVMSMTGYPDKPTGTGWSAGDAIAGLNMALGIMFALWHRSKTGEGQVIDVAMSDSMLQMAERGIIYYSLLGENPKRHGCRDDSAYPYDLFEAKDGYCILGNSNMNDWSPFAKAVGLEDLIDDPRFDTNDNRKKNEEELFPLINAWTKQRTRAEIEEVFAKAGEAYSPVLTISEVVEHEQFKVRDMIIDMEDPDYGKYKIQGVAIKMSLTPGSVDTPAPSRGQNNEEIMARINITPEQIQELKKEGVM